ncbi:MAG: dTMP kinase [Synergistaceae bacterium]|jgi:dTMP kinase|nr:dTMP kinase [Synergistaceae bacterium]
MFFVLEGIDGSGKTTQADRVERWLKGALGGDAVLRTREPGGWEGAERARQFVLDGGLVSPWSEFFFFMLDRCEHVERVIKPALSAGKIVLSDRYAPSTFAYQIFANPAVPPESADYLERLPEVIGLPAPDAVFLLDVDARTAAARLFSRGAKDGFDGRGGRYFEMVRDGYERVGRRAKNWIKIDASGSEDDVFAGLASRITGLLELN